MKKSLLIIVAVVLSTTAQALVADRFKCSIELKDLGSKASTKEEKDFFIVRLPLSASPAPDVRLTAGQTMQSLTMETSQVSFIANLNFYYKHAVRVDAQGNPLEARQMTCIGLTGDFCPKGGGDGDYQICAGGTVVECSEPENPFDPNYGWPLAGLKSGIPTFNEQTLGPATATISEENGKHVGIVSLDCHYMGSFQ